jgi:dTDP-4-dehydrorhamnose 3,5-epimerase
MNVLRTDLPEVVILEPKVFEDRRGLTYESYNRRAFQEAVGQDVEFVQDNRSRSLKNVIRGLHYQVVKMQGKLVTVLRGEIFDVAVDVRRGSPTFGKWTGFRMSDARPQAAWIPPGFAHGFLVLSDSAEVQYKLSDFWSPAHERTIAWDDPQIGVRWPLAGAPVLSEKDRAGKRLAEAELPS